MFYDLSQINYQDKSSDQTTMTHSDSKLFDLPHNLLSDSLLFQPLPHPQFPYNIQTSKIIRCLEASGLSELTLY